ncbi:MAG TPA: hypothetical protein VGH57_37665, partial [Amycolatopsis sp.]
MPITPTYPGVYIDELPSAVRTIVGVPTSTAAFLGTAPRGAVDKPVHITSWEDYAQEFGGLDAATDMTYAVYQFYANGGSEAEIVRVVRKPPPEASKQDAATTDPAPTVTPAAAATIALPGGVTLTAASEGAWANAKLRARVDYDTAPDAAGNLYNLTIRDASTGVTEQFLNVSKVRTDSRALRHVVASSSLIGTVTGDDQRPAKHDDVTDGSDPFPDDPKGKNLYTAAAGGVDGDVPGTADYRGDP